LRKESLEQECPTSGYVQNMIYDTLRSQIQPRTRTPYMWKVKNMAYGKTKSRREKKYLGGSPRHDKWQEKRLEEECHSLDEAI
jgi:hypothetical protein